MSMEIVPSVAYIVMEFPVMARMYKIVIRNLKVTEIFIGVQLIKQISQSMFLVFLFGGIVLI